MLPKKNRIKKTAEYRKIFKGKLVSSSHFSVFFTKKQLCEETKFGFVITRKYGKANKRNKIKRQLSHICKEAIKTKSYGFNIVIKPRPDVAFLQYKTIYKEILLILNNIFNKK